MFVINEYGTLVLQLMSLKRIKKNYKDLNSKLEKRGITIHYPYYSFFNTYHYRSHSSHEHYRTQSSHDHSVTDMFVKTSSNR